MGENPRVAVATAWWVVCALILVGAAGAQAGLRVEEPRLAIHRSRVGNAAIDFQVSKILLFLPELPSTPRVSVRGGEFILKEQLEAGGTRTLHLDALAFSLFPRDSEGVADFRTSGVLVSERSRGTFALDGRSVSSEDGTSRIDGEFRGTDLDLAPLLLRLSWIRELEGLANLTLSIQGSGALGFSGKGVLDFPTTRLNLAGIEIEGHGDLDAEYSLRDRKFSLHNAVVNADRARFAGHQTQQLSTTFDFIDKEFIASDLRFDAHGGKWVQRGRIGVSPPARFEVDTQVSGASISRIATAIAPASNVSDEFGALNGAARLSGIWDREPGWSRSITGEGVLEVLGGQLRSFQLFRSALGALAGRFPRIVPASVDFSETKPTQIHRVFQTFRMEEAAVWSDNIVAVADDYAVTGSGRVGLDGELGLDIRVTFTEQGFGKMFGVTKIPLPARVIDILPPLPAHVSGKLTDPAVAMDLTQIRPAAFDALFGNVRGATGMLTRPAKSLKDAAGRGLGKLGEVVEGALDADREEEN